MLPDKKIGFIGFGEISSIYGESLVKHGWRVYTYDHRYDEKSARADRKHQYAKELNIELVPTLEELATRSRYILSTVTPANAAVIAYEIASTLTEKHIFLDLNSTNPQVKKQNSLLFKESSYLDGAIMGSPKSFGINTPIYYSGNLEVDQLPYRSVFNLKKVGTEIGQASAIKMCQSIITKGFQSLIWEHVLLAEKWGILDFATESLTRVLASMSYKDWLEYSVKTNVVHSARRVEEMNMVIDSLQHFNLPDGHSRVTYNTFKWLAAQKLNESYSDTNAETKEIIQHVVTNFGGIPDENC